MMNDIQEIDQASPEAKVAKSISPDSDMEILDSSHPDFHAREISRKFKQRCKE